MSATLGNVNLVVIDIDRSRTFYAAVIGLTWMPVDLMLRASCYFAPAARR